jgi:hypothetical protein
VQVQAFERVGLMLLQRPIQVNAQYAVAHPAKKTQSQRISWLCAN